LLVEFISNSEEALGVSVPMPALPVDGKIFVCAIEMFANNKMAEAVTIDIKIFTVKFFFCVIV